MKTVHKAVLLACILFLLAGFRGAKDIEASDNEVVPIDAAGLEKLMESDICPLIVTFVTARCRACRDEMPVYQEMYEQYKEKGLEIFMVSIDFAYPQHIQNLVDRLNLTYPVFWGGDEVMHTYDISLVPYKKLVMNGEVVETAIGGWSALEIEQKVLELIEACQQ